jgi:hypothetical protein
MAAIEKEVCENKYSCKNTFHQINLNAKSKKKTQASAWV